MRTLHERGVGARPGTHAVTELGYYRRRFGPTRQLPGRPRLQERTIALPLHNRMTTTTTPTSPIVSPLCEREVHSALHLDDFTETGCRAVRPRA